MVIDIHAHAWPDKVSHKARASLESHYTVKLVGDPTVSTLLRFMDKNHIDYSAVCAVASRPEQVRSINAWLLSIKDRRIKFFAALHPDYPDWKEELKRLAGSACGIKLQPSFQDFYVDDEKAFPLYEEIQRLGMYILFHSGAELGPQMIIRSTPERLARLMKRFSRLKMIAAHFGGFRFWDEVRQHLLGQDIYFDTSAFFGYLPDAQARELILAHRPDRILFGTDFPIVDQQRDLDYIKRLDLPVSLSEKILFQNSCQVLGLPGQ